MRLIDADALMEEYEKNLIQKVSCRTAFVPADVTRLIENAPTVQEDYRGGKQMSKTQNNGRNQLVDMVRATGDYISANADNLVDMADLKTGFTMTVTFDPETAPEIAVEQVHAMRNVLEVLYG